MRVIDLRPEDEELYFQCLEDWSSEIREGGRHKERWYRRNRERGLRVKLALDDAGTVAGMIQYLPIERSDVRGRGLYFIYCVWVHGYPRGRGNFQKRGMGAALLEAAEADARALGATGMAAWGLALPFFMRASWFRKHGYVPADRTGMMVLLWKRFAEDAEPPHWILKKKVPAPTPGRVTVSAFIDGWCPAQNMVIERARRAAAELGPRVAFEEYHTCDRAVFEEWGISGGLFVDGREVRTGPPPSYERVRAIIARRLRRLGA
jgi:GNAT superfamily N-acetyltransferase